MPRLALASLFTLLYALTSLAAEPEPTPVEMQLAIQTAMADARKHLDAKQPAEAVAALEKEVANADGNKAFLSLLREAYLADLTELEKRPNADPYRLAQTKRKLALLGGAAPENGTGALQPPLAK